MLSEANEGEGDFGVAEDREGDLMGWSSTMPSNPPPNPPPFAPCSPMGVDYGSEAERLRSTGSAVTVTDPQTFSEGRNKHTYYLVEIRRSSNTVPISIRRRYSDFTWLYHQLCNVDCPGAIVIIIPHRTAALPFGSHKRFDDDFVEERRKHLSRFICSVLNNPELTDAPSLASFLSPSFDSSLVSNGTPSYDDNAILGYMASVPLPPPILSSPESKQSVERNVGKASFQIRNLFDKTRRTAVGAVARLGGGNGIDVARTDDEEAFADVERYVNALDEQVKVMSKLASKIVKSCAESGRDLDEIGDALYAVGEVHSPSDDNAAQVEQVTEGENSTTSVKPRSEMIKSRSAGSMFAKMGDGISAVSLLWRQLAESDESMFDEPLQELARDVHAAKVAIQRRKDWQWTYTNRIQDVAKREGALSRQSSHKEIPGQTDRVSKAGDELKFAQQKAVVAEGMLQLATERVLREVVRFRVSFQSRLNEVICDYARKQIEYNREKEDAWMKLLPFLDSSTAAQRKN